MEGFTGGVAVWTPEGCRDGEARRLSLNRRANSLKAIQVVVYEYSKIREVLIVFT